MSFQWRELSTQLVWQREAEVAAVGATGKTEVAEVVVTEEGSEVEIEKVEEEDIEVEVIEKEEIEEDTEVEVTVVVAKEAEAVAVPTMALAGEEEID